MRRILEVLSISLLLAGLELSVGTLSITSSRIRESFSSAFGVVDAVPVPWTFWVGMGMVMAAISMGVTTLWARIGEKRIQTDEGCAKCGENTVRVRRGTRHRILGRLLGKTLTARRCGECGWRGLCYKY